MKVAPIRIGWSAKELEWLRAAITLPGYECICALDDIASMSGRTIGAIRAKAKDLVAECARTAAARRILVPARAVHPARNDHPAIAYEPIRQPTKAQLMSGRAR